MDHGEQNMADIVGSISSVGLARSIVVDEENNILAGNGVTEGAAELDLTRVRFVEADGNELIAVRRRNLSAEQKAELRVRDNHTARTATWQIDALDRAAEQAGKSLRDLGFSSEEVTRLRKKAALDGAGDKPEVPAPEVEAAKEVAAEMGIEHGQIWQLGNHYLACGDSEKQPELTARLIELAGGKPILMVTDPPYGIEYDQEYRIGHRKEKRKAETVTNDDRADWSPVFALWKGAVTVSYVWYAALKDPEVRANIEALGHEPRAQLVWVKGIHGPMTRGHYNWFHEPLYYAVAKNPGKGGALWSGLADVKTVLEGAPPYQSQDETEKRSGHPTQKLIGHYVHLAGNHTHEVMADPFCGSGTLILAAERLGRRGLGIELEPHWCAVAITRWLAETGSVHEPTRLE